MKNHEIKLEMLQEWLNNYEVTYAISTSPKKKLSVAMNGTLKVYDNDNVVWETMQPFQAVEKYNDIF